MSITYTTSDTFTRTNARYLASKIAADLRQMQIFYRRPSDKKIADYITEAVTLLLGGYLDEVSYGFRRGDEWVVALKYKVTSGGVLSDDRSGRVPPGKDIEGASWYSYLECNSSFYALTSEEQSKIEAELPISRTAGVEPTARGGWKADRSYSSGGVGLNRQTLI